MAETLQSIRDELEGGKPVAILGLGDSLTQGWMVARGFFDRACDDLESRYLDGRVLRRINAGVPGDTAAGGVRRVGDLLAVHPRLVTVQFGLNDCLSGEYLDVYRRNLNRIAETVLRSGAVVLLATSCPPAPEQAQRAVRPFYEAIRGLGQQLSLPVADLERYWLQEVERDQVDEPLFLADGVHPSDAGHALLARGLVAAIQELD